MTTLDYKHRLTFEEALGLKPVSAKIAPRTATAAFDSPHYAPYAAAINGPSIETEMLLKGMYEQSAMHYAIQQLNLDGAQYGIHPLDPPRPPTASMPSSRIWMRTSRGPRTTKIKPFYRQRPTQWTRSINGRPWGKRSSPKA